MLENWFEGTYGEAHLWGLALLVLGIVTTGAGWAILRRAATGSRLKDVGVMVLIAGLSVGALGGVGLLIGGQGYCGPDGTWRPCDPDRTLDP